MKSSDWAIKISWYLKNEAWRSQRLKVIARDWFRQRVALYHCHSEHEIIRSEWKERMNQKDDRIGEKEKERTCYENRARKNIVLRNIP